MKDLSYEMRDREGATNGLRIHLGLGLETIYTFFFLNVGLVEPIWFGSF